MFYKDEVFYFKRILIQMKSFVLQKKMLFLQNSAETTAICYQTVHLCYYSSSLLLKLFIETKAFIIVYSNEIRYLKRVLIEIKASILKQYILFM